MKITQEMWAVAASKDVTHLRFYAYELVGLSNKKAKRVLVTITPISKPKRKKK